VPETYAALETVVAAELAAAKCHTCTHPTPAGLHSCLGCSAPCRSYSCIPGYCPTCAHDPRLMSLEDACSDDACAAHANELERLERDFATDAADLKAIREWLCAITLGPPAAELSLVALRVDEAVRFEAWAQVLLEVADRLEGARFARRLGAYPGHRCAERAVLWLRTDACAVFVHGPWRPATAADYERIAREAE
jgi:hypothetical protein